MTPGALLAILLRDRGWSQATLAEAIGRPAQAISEIVTGKKRVTAATARQLETALGLSARVWMMLQAETDLERERERIVDGAP